MIAADIQTTLPLVHRGTSALVAARLLTRRHLPGVVIADEHSAPIAVVSSADVLRLLVSRSASRDGAAHADAAAGSSPRLLGELLDGLRGATTGARPIVRVSAAATLEDLAATLLAAEVDVAIVEGQSDGDEVARFVSLPAVLEALLAERADGGDPA